MRVHLTSFDDCLGSSCSISLTDAVLTLSMCMSEWQVVSFMPVLDCRLWLYPL